MRYLSIFFGICLFSLFGFSQNVPTVTLVFVAPVNNSYKNFEAVIDGVSYYPENTPVSRNKSHTVSMPAASRNTIWINNLEPGKHIIQVYSLKEGSNDVREGNSPVYASAFAVKNGFDTKIAVKSDGQVQFSERLSADNNSSSISRENNNVYSPAANNKTANKNSGKKIKHNENNSAKDAIASTANSDQNNDDTRNNENNPANGRHSRKRIDTAIVINDAANNNENAVRNSNSRVNHYNNNHSNDEQDDQMGNGSKIPMDDNNFNKLYENLRNQWHPGQRMKSLIKEFLNAKDNFTTSQAKQLIKLVTEEGNRLKLAKSSYHCITDPQNFGEMDDVLRYKASRDELDKFVKDGQD